MDCEYVRENYNVPAEVGRRVIVSGRHGVIAEDRGNYIGVNFDDEPPQNIHNCHPTSEVEYGKMGVVRKVKITRSQKRYQDYLDCDWCGSFAEFIGARR